MATTAFVSCTGLDILSTQADENKHTWVEAVVSVGSSIIASHFNEERGLAGLCLRRSRGDTYVCSTCCAEE
jgi:hypothetical protein